MIILFGRFIQNYILGLQSSAILCFFVDDECYIKTDQVRLALNVIGMLISLLIIYIEQRFTICIFPDPNVPWAQIRSGYELLNRMLILLSVMLLVLEKYIILKFQFYLILIPTTLIATFQLWYSYSTIKFFSNWVNTTHLIKDVIIWNLGFYGITIDLISIKSDMTYCILIILSIIVMFLLLKFNQQEYYLNHLKFDNLPNKNVKLWMIYAYLKLISQKDNSNELIVSNIYQQHTIKCENLRCFCKKQRIDIRQTDNFCEISYDKEERHDGDEIESLQTDGENQDSKNKRDQILMRVLMQKLKQGNDEKQARFFEIYVNVQYFKRLYSSLFKLMNLKSKTNSNSDKYSNYYLQHMITKQIKDNEKKIRQDVFELDTTLMVDHQFQEYKKLIFDTTILVDSFWRTLAKHDYEIDVLIYVGQSIVDSYLQTKTYFDSILENQQDFKELILMQMFFINDVMNFEQEGLNLQNLIKNIQQKQMITRQSVYMKQNEQQGLIIVSCSPQKKNKILLINEILCEKIRFKPLQLIGKNINYIMPKIVGQIHDTLIENFLTYNHNRHLTTSLPRVWFKTQNQNIVHAKIELQTCVSENRGLVLVGLVSLNQDIITQNINCKAKEAFLMIVDEKGHIENASQNFMIKFMGKNIIAIDDFKIHIDELMIINENYSRKELRNGVTAELNELFQGKPITSVINIKQQIFVIINEFNLPNKIFFKEYIFIEIEGQQNFNDDVIMIKSFEVNQKLQRNEIEDIDDLDQNIMELNPSSQSGSSRYIEVLNFKGAIDFKQTPKSLSNLRKAILIFFCILIGTSFSVLGVTQQQNKQFIEDSGTVKSSIQMGGKLAYIRLAFRILLIYPRQTNFDLRFSFSYLQTQMETFYEQLQESVYDVLDENNYTDLVLKDFMLSDNVMIQEMQADGTILWQLKKISLAIQQFMTKLQKFITMDQKYFSDEMIQFRTRNIPKNPTLDQRDAYYIIINGMYDLRSFILEMSDLFITQSQDKENIHDLTVLVITMSCVAVTFLSSFLLIPVTFALDTEQENIVKQWMKISQLTKMDVIERIEEFTTKFQDKKLKEEFNIKIIQQAGDQKALGQNNSIQNIINSSSIDKNSGMINFESQCNLAMSNETMLNNTRYPLFEQMNSIFLQQFDGDQTNKSNFLMMLQNDITPNLLNENNQSILPLDAIYSSEQIQIQSQTQIQNVIIQDENSELQKNTRKQQKNQLKHIYKIKKLWKVLMIISFATIIFGFYLAFYFISSQVFQTAKQSFTFLQNTNRRAPCLANVYQFLLETYAQNKTIRIGYTNQTIMDHIQQNCMVFEQKLQDHQKIVPPQLISINSFIKDLNSEKFCDTVFPQDINEQIICKTFKNGIMNLGLANAYNSMYYYLFSELVAFDEQPRLRTDEFLNEHTSKNQTQDYIMIIYRYILPATDAMSQKVELALEAYMESQISIFLIVFCFFLIFLIISLIFSLGKMISQLKKDVFRTRVLVKIVPAQELSEIHRRERKKANRIIQEEPDN